jgi:hypothetical protein
MGEIATRRARQSTILKSSSSSRHAKLEDATRCELNVDSLAHVFQTAVRNECDLKNLTWRI